MKKIIISLLCGIAFIAPTALSASLFFPDVKSSDWFYSDVKNMSDWGIIKGNADGTYAPSKNVNRAELATILNRYEQRITNKLANNSGTTSTNISDTTSTDNSLIKRIEALEQKDVDILQTALKNDALFFNSLKKDTSDAITKHHELIIKNLTYIREAKSGEMYNVSYLLPYDFSLSSESCSKLKNNFNTQQLQNSIYANTIKTVGCN